MLQCLCIFETFNTVNCFVSQHCYNNDDKEDDDDDDDNNNKKKK